MKMYLTKYALSSGIKEIKTLPGHSEEYCKEANNRWSESYKIGRDVFSTEGSAMIDAQQRRAARISSLKKQIDKLEKVTFKIKRLPEIA